MTTFVALLRAVNVGGTAKLAMTDLKSLCEGLGFSNVRTFIQSGNVVFDSAWTEQQVKAALETALSTLLKKQATVFVRSGAELADVLDRNPFSSAEGNRVLVYFFDEAIDGGALAAIPIPGREEMRSLGRELYVHYPDGSGRSKLKLSTLGVGTARNVNSVAKLAAMATS